MKAWHLSLLVIFCCLLGCKEAQSSRIEATTNPDMEGKTITIQGKALNSKAGAVAGSYFVEGLTHWPDDAYNRMVEVTGKLKLVEHAEEDLYTPEGLVKQGMVGTQYILTKPRWHVLE